MTRVFIFDASIVADALGVSEDSDNLWQEVSNAKA